MPNNIISKMCVECAILGGNPCSACATYLSWAAKIEEAEAALNRMREEQAKLLPDINAAHDRLTRRLPREITTMIFEFCVPELNSDASTEDLTVYKVSAPLVLADVCRSWRDIAFSLSQLWTALRLSFADMLSPVRLSVAREWLERTNERPLSITIKYEFYNEGEDDKCEADEQSYINSFYKGYNNYYQKPDRGDESPVETYARFTELINGYSGRWENLRIDCPSELLNHFSGDAKLGAPMLRKLELCRIGDGDPLIDIQWGHSSSEVMSLLRPQRVLLEGYSHSVLAFSQWANITYLQIEDTGFRGGLLHVLQNAPNLINCTVVYSLPYDDFLELPSLDPDGYKIVHNSLKSLQICPQYFEGVESVRVLSNLMLPSLKDLRFWVIQTTLLAGILVPFLKRSRSTLSSLCITIGQNMEDELVEVLYNVPSLQTLDVTIHYPQLPTRASDQLITTLAETTTADRFLPRLHSFSYGLSFGYINGSLRIKPLWTKLLNIFGQPHEWSDSKRRPFQHLSVSNIPYLNSGQAFQCPVNYLEDYIVLRILHLKSKTQYIVEALSEHDHQARKQHDLLKLLINYYEQNGIPILDSETDTWLLLCLPDLQYPDI